MLRQVLVNLCDNSSLALGDRRGRLELGLGSDAEGPFVEVSDDGPGIADEVRSRLFEPYTTTRTIGHGMGLGLAISKKIMLDHDGDLELLRTSEDGTTFRLTLPPCPEEMDV
ncbi:MAG: two-component sensor histidine kinase, partial [Bosea sp.]|uniref:ATP-binding protein n=1 Tax=Bosea sp. (in: a-proteobacteria) TaxID=1871050 RepID=UPI0031FF1EBA|nr:two-component sensor histidine kinase [Bosea sp. (in: a-proteobacteria)]